MPRLCGYCGGAVNCAPFVWLLWRSCRFKCQFLHSCIGQASTQGLRSCLTQSDIGLLIYGREKAKFVVASKTALLFVSSNFKIKYIFRERLLASY